MVCLSFDRFFTWDSNKFPDSEEMINNVASKGRKMVTIVDPHLKSDGNYKIYTEARDQGFNVKNKDGNDYDGWCWPGRAFCLTSTVVWYLPVHYWDISCNNCVLCMLLDWSCMRTRRRRDWDILPYLVYLTHEL